MTQDAAPARHDIGAALQRRLAGMQADHGAGWRPDLVHAGDVAFGEGAIEGAVGGQHGLALLVVEFRQEWRQARWPSWHSSLETPRLPDTFHA